MIMKGEHLRTTLGMVSSRNPKLKLIYALIRPVDAGVLHSVNGGGKVGALVLVN
jgi:hypothetical protein